MHLLFVFACTKDSLDSGTLDSADTGEAEEPSTACPPWAGLEQGTDLDYEDTPEHQADTGTKSTFTHTVVSHGPWGDGTLVTTSSVTTYEASHLEDFAGEYTRTYGCDDEGAWMLTTEYSASWTAGGEVVESSYSTEWDGYLSMPWAPEEGWTTTWTRTQTDANGSFSDEGSFTATLADGSAEVETGIGTFEGIAIEFDGDRAHYYDEEHGLLRSPSSWLTEL